MDYSAFHWSEKARKQAERAKEIVDSIGSVLHYKGSVATRADLPVLGQELGDMYNILSDGSNVVWTGSVWDEISGVVDLSEYRTASDQDAIDSGKVPTSRTVNGKALSSNISLTASDVGALPDSTVIPTVNDATLTIQKNGTSVATFTANSSTNQTANIAVPTKTSDITNDSGYITNSALSGYLPLSGGNITGDLTIKTDFNVGKLELVDGVKAVEYIQTSNGAYSEIDYYGNQNTEIEVDVTVLSVPDASTTVLQFCGDITTAQKLLSVSGVRFDEGAAAPSGSCRFGNKTQNWPPSAGIQYNKRYKVISNKNYTRRVSTEDTAYPDISLSFLYTGTFTTGGRLWICRTHGSSRYCNARFHGFKIYESGALVRNYVPAKTTKSVTISGQSFAANVAGFFDTVSGKFFNAASGTYTAGSDGVTNYKVSSTSANSLLFGNDGSIKLDAALSTDDYSKKLTTSEWVSDKLKDYLKTDGGNIDGDLTVKEEVSLGDGLVNTVTGYTFYDYISIGPSTYIPINLSRTTDTIKTELDGYFAAFSGHTDFAILNGSKYNVPISSDAGTGVLTMGNYSWSSTLVVEAGSRFLLKTNRNVAEYEYTTSNNIKAYSTTINTPLCYTPPVSTTINIGQNAAHPVFSVYSMRVYNANTGELTNLFVPAKRTLDDEIGVYDIVTNTFTAAYGSNKSLGSGVPEVDMSFFSGTNVALDYYIGSNNTPRIKLSGDGKTELVETPLGTATGKEIVDAEWVLGKGYTSNVGTVTSVNNVSPVSGNVTLSIPTVNNPTITITQGGVPKGSFTLNQSSGDTISLDAGGGSPLPSQTGQSGKFLTTDGTDASWASIPSDSTKADKDLSNIDNAGNVASSALNTAGIRTVVETYNNGTDWYRIWSDGWCEQGGYVTGGVSWGVVTVNLLKTMSNTNYSVDKKWVCSSAITGASYDATGSVYNRSNMTTSSFPTYNGRWDGFFWEVCGYVEQGE